jgi:hypothetical protein
LPIAPVEPPQFSYVLTPTSSCGVSLELMLRVQKEASYLLSESL